MVTLYLQPLLHSPGIIRDRQDDGYTSLCFPDLLISISVYGEGRAEKTRGCVAAMNENHHATVDHEEAPSAVSEEKTGTSISR